MLPALAHGLEGTSQMAGREDAGDPCIECRQACGLPQADGQGVVECGVLGVFGGPCNENKPLSWRLCVDYPNYAAGCATTLTGRRSQRVRRSGRQAVRQAERTACSRIRCRR